MAREQLLCGMVSLVLLDISLHKKIRTVVFEEICANCDRETYVKYLNAGCETICILKEAVW